MDTAKAATSSGIQHRRALQSLSARSRNERLLVRGHCYKLLACWTLHFRKCLFSFASCGLVYSISSLKGKIKTPRSTFRPCAAGIGTMALPVLWVDWPLYGSRPLKYELFSRSGWDFICTSIRGMEFFGTLPRERLS